MKELNKTMITHNEEFDIDINNVLTPEQIEGIATEMLKYGKTTEREYVENISLAKICTNIPEDFDYEKNYNLLLSNGVFLTIYNNLENVYQIQEYIDYEESIEKQLKVFLQKINVPVAETAQSFNKFIQGLDTDKLVKLLAKK
jgi:hypothetical protein